MSAPLDFKAARARLRPGSKPYHGERPPAAVAPDGHDVEVTQAGGLVVFTARYAGARLLEFHWSPESAEQVAALLSRFAFAARKDTRG